MYGLLPMLGARQEISWEANTVQFDAGSPLPYYYRSGGLSTSSGKEGSAVFRINVDQLDTDTQLWRSSSNRFAATVYALQDRLYIKCNGESPDENTQKLMISCNTNSIVVDTWITLLYAWDVSVGTSASRVYVNNTSDFRSTGSQADNVNLRYNTDDIGAFASQAGATPFEGCVQAMAFADTYVDWDVLGNREKVMVDPTGGDYTLRDPGNGSNWFGQQAEMLWIGDASSYTNTGDGGAFTQNAAPTDGCSK
jgi:hypothetical protein